MTEAVESSAPAGKRASWRRAFVVGIVVVAAAIAATVIISRINKAGDRLILSGNVETTEVHLGFKAAGRVESLGFLEGDEVTAGRELAKLEDTDLAAREDEARAALAVAEANAAQAEAALNFVREDANARIARARARLDELEHGSLPEEIACAAAERELARAELTRAEAEWERQRRLYDEKVISASQRDLAKADYEKAVARERAARETLTLAQKGPRAEIIAAYRAELSAAEAGLLEARRQEEAARVARAEIDLARARLALAAVERGYAHLFSPLDGVVLRKNFEPGELVALGAPVVSVADIRHPWVRAYVNEPDMPRVRHGDRAIVVADGLEREFIGRVSFISDKAEFTPKNIETHAERVRLVYRIKIEVDNPEKLLKSGMPVTVKLTGQAGERAAR